MSKKQQEIEAFYELGDIYEDGFYSPILYRPKTSGAIQQWQIAVKLFDDGELITPTDAHVYDRKTSEDQVAHVVSQSHQTGGTITEWTPPTVITKGTNIGRKNYTTPYTQALYVARSKYTKKVKTGFQTDMPIPGKGSITFESLCSMESRGKTPWRVYPEKVHDFTKYGHKINDQFYIEPKLDGIFMTVVYHPCIDKPNNVDAYTIAKETIEGVDHIIEELLPTLRDFPGLHVCGELYQHGMSLQEISGHARRLEDSKHTNKVLLDYYVFDCFYIDDENKNIPYEERVELLEEVIPAKAKYTRLNKRVETTRDNFKEYYEKYLKDGYEGAIIRNPDGIYRPGLYSQYRSYDVQKLKPRYDDEFEIIGYEDGKAGKEVGAVKFKCKTKTGETFNVTPNMTYEERYALFKKMSMGENGKTHFENEWKGKPYTVQYSILSKDGVPQQPKGLGKRDPRTI